MRCHSVWIAMREPLATIRNIRWADATSRTSYGPGEIRSTSTTRAISSHRSLTRLLKWDAHSRMLAFEFIIWVGLIGQGCGCGSLSHRGGPTYGHPKGSRHYNGAYLWNLNPRFGVNGHFPLPGKVHRSFTAKKKNIRARIDVTVIDIYERHHKLLPVGYVLTPSENDWYLEPVERELNIAEPRF